MSIAPQSHRMDALKDHQQEAQVIVILGDDLKLNSEMIKMACSAARPTGMNMLACYGINMPRARRIEDRDPEQEERALKFLKCAAEIVARFEMTLQTEIVRSRHLAASIADEVTSHQAELLIMGIPCQKSPVHPNATDDLITYVLDNVACRVWLIRGKQDSAGSTVKPAR